MKKNPNGEPIPEPQIISGETTNDKTERILNILATTLRCSVLAIGAAYILVYLWMALAKRMPYPFELEWFEDQSVIHVQRILRGLPLYVPPSLNFIPTVYTPLYYYVSALSAQLMPLGYSPLRLVSLLSSIGLALLIFRIVRTRTGGSWFWGFLAASFMIASFRVTGAWLDVARVDSLFLFLALAAIMAFSSRIPLLNSGLAPALMFLAFFTKQSGLVVSLPLAAWSLYHRRGPSRFLFSGIFFGAVLLSTFVMNRLSDGWYSFHVFTVASGHGIDSIIPVHFWSNDMFMHAGIACVFTAVYFLHGLRHRNQKEWSLDAAILIGMVLVSYLSRLHVGGYTNCLLPAYAALAIYSALGMSLLAEKGGREADLVKSGIHVAVLIQLLALFYWPGDQIPTPAAEAQGKRVITILKLLEGDVFMPNHPWYPAMAGKATFANTVTITDVQRSTNVPDSLKITLQNSILGAIAERRFTAIVLDGNGEFPSGAPQLEDNYTLVNNKLSDETFNPLTGEATSPRLLYMVKSTR